jgi:hypothetical protein
MFTGTRAKIASGKAAWKRFVTAVEQLTVAVEKNTDTISANTKEQTLLRSKLDEIGNHTKFLSDQKRVDLNRAGHKVA